MRKFIYVILVLFLVIGVYHVIWDKKDENLVSVGEVTHSVFYTPFYVAIENGYFKEEGINIDLSLISGANNVASAILSGDINIGFMGPEASIYVYNGGEKDYIKSFAGLTKRDGQFLISRESINDFKWDYLKDKEVLAGRIGGMPYLNFINALNNVGIDKNIVDVNTSVDFASLTSAFISGEGDFVNLFEPNATKLVNMGYGFIVDSIGSKSGVMPYTTFSARSSYIEANKGVLKGFNKALNKGLEFTRLNNSRTLAKIIKNQFKDISLDELDTMISRYKDADTWFKSVYIEEDAFMNLEKLMIENNLIDKEVKYSDLVINIE